MQTTTTAAAAATKTLRPSSAQDLSAPHWRMPAVLHYTGLSRTTFLDMVRAGEAPKARKIPGRRVVMWRATEVKAFMDALPLATADDVSED